MGSIAFYRSFLTALQAGPVLLATVVQVKGSVPRDIGAKMLVDPQGHSLDTIGGGAGEAKVIQQALTVWATGQKQATEIDLSGAPQRETQGICGGTMRVWLEPWQGEAAIAIVQQILSRLETGQPITLVTPFTSQNPYLWDAVGLPLSPPEQAFIEVLQPPPLLFIVGAGHVGEQLAKVGALIGFQVAVQDDRPAWANSQRYPQARIFTADLEHALTELTSHRLYVALVTRGYSYDLAALLHLLHRPLPCAYIGMIGSQKRVRQVYQTLLKQGIPAERLQSLYAPIGLDIGAETPAEIAISIGAELIRVQRGGTGRSLSELLSWG